MKCLALLLLGLGALACRAHQHGIDSGNEVVVIDLDRGLM
jgi:hypothetical protein